MREFDFSFFTLPDSGAFLTHAPRRLNEAFALLYPFQSEVWPLLIFTVIVSGPILFLMIAIPQWIIDRRAVKILRKPKTFFSMTYIREITGEVTFRQRRANKRNREEYLKVGEIVGGKKDSKLFANCVWFTCCIFLGQCKQKNEKFFKLYRNEFYEFFFFWKFFHHFSNKFSSPQPFRSLLFNYSLAISYLRAE